MEGRRVAVITCGTRGDTQPLISLCLQMKKVGAHVLMLTNVNHVEFVSKFGLEVKGTSLDLEQILSSELYRRAWSSGDDAACLKMFGTSYMEHFHDALPKELSALTEFAPELLLYCGINAAASVFYSTVLAIPAMRVSLQTVTPDETAQKEAEEAAKGEYFAKRLGELAAIEEQFGRRLGGSLWPDFHAFLLDSHRPIAPTIVAWSPELCAPPESMRLHYKVTGFLELTDEEKRSVLQEDRNFGGESNEQLRQFLADGDPPVYVGWGSMAAMADPKQMVSLAVHSLKFAARRGVIVGGWGRLSASLVDHPGQEELQEFIRNNIIFIQSAPHEWLFPQCSVLVHHAGAGTCAAAIRAGVPSVMTPFTADQPQNAAVVTSAGCGVACAMFREVGAEQLGSDIVRCAEDQRIRARCQETGRLLREERGSSNAVAEIQKFLREDVDTGAWRDRFEERLKVRVGPAVPLEGAFNIPAEKVESLDPPLQPDEGIVAQLVSMGLRENACRRACLAVRNSGADAAITWYYEHADDPDADEPMASGAGAAAAEREADPEGVAALASMGFAERQAEGALRLCGNDVERAADWLLAHVDDLDGALAAAR